MVLLPVTGAVHNLQSHTHLSRRVHSDVIAIGIFIRKEKPLPLEEKKGYLSVLYTKEIGYQSPSGYNAPVALQRSKQ